MKDRTKSKLEARQVDRLVSAFLAGMADSAEYMGRMTAAKLLRRRSRVLQPASLIHNGKKARK